MINWLVYFWLFLFTCLLFFSCKRVKPAAPVATQLDSTLTVPVSTITFPVSYGVDKLEEMVNSKIRGTFLNERFSMNEKGDSLFITIEKQRPIRLSWSGRTLTYMFPVKVSGKFIKKIAGINVRNQVPVETECEISLATSFSLDDRWNLVPQSKLESITWIKEPTLKIAMIRVKLKKTIEEAIKKHQDELIIKLDETIQGLIDTRKVVTKLWRDVQNPIRVNKKGKEVWLKGYATGLAGGLVDTDRENVTFKIQLQARIQTLIDDEPVPPSNRVLPRFRPLTSKAHGDSLEVFVLARIPFTLVNEMLNEELRGKKLEAQGYAATIQKIQLYGTPHGFALMMAVKGDANGQIYATATPGYDTATSVLYIDKVAFDVDTENILVRSANWLLYDHALDFITRYTSIDVQPFIDQIPALIMGGVEKGNVGQKINLTMGTLMVRPYQHLITKDDFQIILSGKGTGAIDLEQKVFVKQK